MKRKLVLSNIMMLLLPIVLIGVITMIFLCLFIVTYPTYNETVNQIDLLRPDVLMQNLLLFIKETPSAFSYVIIWGCLCLVVVVGVITSNTIWLSKSILPPIRELTRAAERIKEGDLDFEVLRAEADELDELCRVFDEMRRQLKISRDMERKHMDERKMLIANISHDLKTPITSIKGYIEGIRDGIADTPQKVEKYLDTVYIKANVIDEMVNNLSLYAKLELGKAQFDYEIMDINQLIEDIISAYRLDLEQNQMKMEASLLQESLLVKLDYQKMYRVFSNLIDNAVKYKKDGIGQIQITTQKLENNVLVTVSDEGIGISQDELVRVFDGFYRVDPARNMRIKGNGLGLGIVKQILEHHSGKIVLKSEENKGTTAYIYLPLRKDGFYDENLDY